MENTKRFLIIDDDEEKIEILIKILRNKKVKFDIAKSYNSAIRNIIQNKYCGIFLDMNFPIFDYEGVQNNEGIKVLSEIKRRKIEIPIAIHSSKYVDVSMFDNVKDYIMYDYSMVYEKKIESFIEKFMKEEINGDL